MGGQPWQGQQGCALAQGHRLLAIVERRGQLAEAIHPRRPFPQRLLRQVSGDSRQVVADGQHLPTALADREQTLGIVAVGADRALDVGQEAHRRGV